MLYAIDFDEVTSELDYYSSTWVVESLDTLYRKSHVVLPTVLEQWAHHKAHEVSVMIGAEVQVTVSRYFPARIGMDLNLNVSETSEVRSVLKEWTHKSNKVSSG